jgi:hypothetical protein
MKKILLSAAAIFAAMSMNAQELCSFNQDNSLGLADDGTALTAGTVIGETASIVAKIGADDTYKKQEATFTIGDGIVFGGLQGGTNPKDADTGVPATTLKQPASGAFLLFEAKADGFLYVLHKASSNKAYTVFEEGTCISYTFAAIGDASTELGAVYQYTLPYVVENEQFVVKESVEWAEQEFLKATNPEAYAAHWKEETADDGTVKKTWDPAIKVNGLGVIKFPVYKDCKYIVNANGSKITAAGFAFSTEDNLTIMSDDVVIYGAGGSQGGGDVVWEGDGSAGAVSWNGIYRFANEEKKTGEEIYAVPMDVWQKMKTTPFFVDLVGENPQIRVTTGWWDTNLTADDIMPGNELLTDNGNGSWTLKVDLSTAPALLDLVDDHHLLFTGDRYYPTKIYFGGATGIQAIKNVKSESNVIYNLAGQKVDANYKGVVIMNGKKFMQK